LCVGLVDLVVFIIVRDAVSGVETIIARDAVVIGVETIVFLGQVRFFVGDGLRLSGAGAEAFK